MIRRSRPARRNEGHEPLKETGRRLKKEIRREELLEEQVMRYPLSNRALLITAEVAGFDIARISIDTGSSVDIIYGDYLRRLNVECEIHPVETDIISFSGDVLGSIEEVILPVSLGDRPVVSMGSVKFLNMDLESPFNMILGRPSLNMF